MTFFSDAHAADATTATTVASTVADTPAVQPPSESQALMMNIGMILILGVLFYLLMVRPQQKRFKAHAEMLGGLGKGTKILTQGGLIGTIDQIVSDHEVRVDVGNGVKLTLMRSYIVGRYEDNIPMSSAANDDSKTKKDKSAK
ncbi:MAG: preprotein translocase subunit YajC [Pseudobdellovibrionaceae bacterium]|jgi:preprotein translocase subunit YajC|nr:preprotein translocase subunit YajC [Pseudobdellovibrionaceae bacterium]